MTTTKSSPDDSIRKQMAEIARHFAAGLLTNDAFEDAWGHISKGALYDVFYWGFWPFSCDLEKHTLTGRFALTPQARRQVARTILFLRSGFPYRWPRITGPHLLPVMCLSLITLGWYGRHWQRKRWAGGDESVWPFFNRVDYEHALAHPVYLRGGTRQ